MYAVVAKNLTYIRNQEILFENFSFEIEQGSYVAVIGPNGGGKTTLMRVMMGLEKSKKGGIQIFGKSISEAQKRKWIGYVPQRGGMLDLSFPATVWEILINSTKQSSDTINIFLEEFHLTHLSQRLIGSLSGGERQRVFLVRALLNDPKILVLDEPIDGLDPKSREDFYLHLQTVSKKGVTIFFITHDVHRIAKEADCALCLKHELVCHGSHACLVSGTDLKNHFHKDKQELFDHHL